MMNTGMLLSVIGDEQMLNRFEHDEVHGHGQSPELVVWPALEREDS